MTMKGESERNEGEWIDNIVVGVREVENLPSFYKREKNSSLSPLELWYFYYEQNRMYSCRVDRDSSEPLLPSS